MLIEPDEVAAVMIGNKWITLVANTFEVHTREWFRTEDHPEIWSFLLKSIHGEWITGPLDSIQAVRTTVTGKGTLPPKPWDAKRPTIVPAEVAQ